MTTKTSYLLLSIVILLFGCSKSDDDSTSPTNTKPAYVAPVDGALSVDISDLILHIGNTATISAKLYDVNSISLPTSNLLWQSSDNSVATVSNGHITAIGVGNCTITVTDGIHGILTTNVSVIANSVSIPTTAFSATINPDFIVMQPNSSKNFTYVTRNAQGAIVNSSLTFLAPNNSGLSISGNTINSGNKTGVYDIIAKSGSDMLKTNFKVYVVDLPQSTTINKDTIWWITRLKNVPYDIIGKDVSVRAPILLDVIGFCHQFNNLDFKGTRRTVTPDNIEFSDNKINLSSEGYIQSVDYTRSNIGTKITFKYKNRVTKTNCGVLFDIESNWGNNSANGNKYNFCITQSGPKIFYTSDGWYNDIPNEGQNTHHHEVPINGTYNIVENGTQVFHGTDNHFTGTYHTLSDSHGNAWIKYSDGSSSNIGFSEYVNGETQPNILHFPFNNDPHISLTRGTGNCTGSNNPNPTTTGSFTINGTTYNGICQSIPDPDCPSALSVAISSQDGSTFLLSALSTTSNGTFPFPISTNFCDLFGEVITANGIDATTAENGTGGTLTKTGARSFTFSCTVKSFTGSQLYTVTGSGNY